MTTAIALREQLEARGLGVVHTVEHRVDCYQIVPLNGEVRQAGYCVTAGNVSPASPTSSHHADSLEQLTLDAA